MKAAEDAAHAAVAAYRAKDGGGKEWYFVPQEIYNDRVFEKCFFDAISCYTV